MLRPPHRPSSGRATRTSVNNNNNNSISSNNDDDDSLAARARPPAQAREEELLLLLLLRPDPSHAVPGPPPAVAAAGADTSPARRPLLADVAIPLRPVVRPQGRAGPPGVAMATPLPAAGAAETRRFQRSRARGARGGGWHDDGGGGGVGPGGL